MPDRFPGVPRSVVALAPPPQIVRIGAVRVRCDLHGAAVVPSESLNESAVSVPVGCGVLREATLQVAERVRIRRNAEVGPDLGLERVIARKLPSQLRRIQGGVRDYGPVGSEVRGINLQEQLRSCTPSDVDVVRGLTRSGTARDVVSGHLSTDRSRGDLIR